MRQTSIRVLLAALILAFLGTPAAFADNVYANIKGVVTDSTGAIVPETQLTATNLATGATKTTVSQSNGHFEFMQLPIGTYTVSATKQGFKTFKSNGIPLVVNQVYDLPVVFQVGNVTETVEVKADAVQVETNSAQQQTLVNSQQIVDLPLNGRNFTQLQQLAPGVMSGSDRFGNGTGGTNFSVNGAQTQQSSFLINGTDSNDISLNTAIVLPSPDAIQEFNLISSTINPEYGRNSGGIVNAVIKNGTNSLHGNAFEFYRDTFLNSHNFFQTTTPEFHQNQFGGTLGGPIWKDKTFFFLSYQGLRNRIPQTVANNTVLSAAQRTGDFSADFAGLASGATLATAIAQSKGVAPVAVTGDDGNPYPAGTPYGPSGCATAPCTTVFHPTTDGLPLALDPVSGLPTNANQAFGAALGSFASSFNPLAVSLMNQFVPLPNAPGNKFLFNPIQRNRQDQGIIRLDQNLTSADLLWGTAIFNHAPNQATLPFIGATLPGFGSVSVADTKEFTVAYNHTFSTTTLNEIRLGYARLNFDAVEPATPAQPSSFGFPGIIPQNQTGAGMPFIGIRGLFSLGFSQDGPQPRKDQNYQFTDNFSKVIGKHTTKFGFDARRFQVDNPFFFENNGAFTFNGTGAASSGDPALDFLLGAPSRFVQNSGGIINARAYEYYGYAQDSWKVKNNLTLTYGTGYQVDTPYNNNQFGGKAFNCIRPGQQSAVFPSAPADLVFPGDANCTQSGTQIRWGHVAPRFGFAWSPDLGPISGGPNKFSVRGGFGIYFNRTEEETALQNLGAPPFGVGSGGIGDAGGSPSFTNPFTDILTGTSIPNKFPFVPPAPGDPNIDFTFFEPMVLNTVDPSLTSPYSQNFNLNIQREFPSNVVASLGYVGSLGRHLYRTVEGNPITLAGAAACLADNLCGGRGRAIALQHLIFPGHSLLPGDVFGSIATQRTDGTSSYNGLQANITKGLTHGLQLIASYTWSHSIDTGSGFEDTGGAGTAARTINPFFPQLNVGDSAFDARQRLVLGYVFQIPSLHGRANWAPNAIFGGWKLSGITTFQTGFPITIGDSGFTSLTCDALSFFGGCPDTPNQVVPNINTFDPRKGTFGGNSNYFFDPASFTPAAPGTFGNVRRNNIHGPGINNTDFALIKDTKLTERMMLETGIEGFNIFNHTQFCTAVSCVDGDVQSPTFGQVLSAAPGRLWQLRAKFNF